MVEYQKKYQSKVKCVTLDIRRPGMAEHQRAVILHALLGLVHPSRWDCL